MFADAAGVDPIWLGVASVVSSVLTTAVGAVASLLRDRRDASRTARADAIVEWQALVSQLTGRVDQLTSDVGRLHDEHMKCRDENAAMRAEVKILREENADLRDEVKSLRAEIASMKA